MNAPVRCLMLTRMLLMDVEVGETSGEVIARTGRVVSIGSGAMIIKQCFEFLLSLLILVCTAPIILLAVLLVRLTSRGPAIYTQTRLGLRGRAFTILKIRSMYIDSESAGPRWSLPGDPRVTPVGWLLRWSHVDELPQLFHVLRGEMSLIGPRPERPEIVANLERALPEYRQRLLVRPGLTGLAQVLQAPDTDLSMVSRKLKLDLHYMDHWSLWLDFRIALATVLHVLRVPPAAIARIFGFPWETNASQKVMATSPAVISYHAPQSLSQPCSTTG